MSFKMRKEEEEKTNNISLVERIISLENTENSW
jgi:hypothetical protein